MMLTLDVFVAHGHVVHIAHKLVDGLLGSAVRGGRTPGDDLPVVPRLLVRRHECAGGKDACSHARSPLRALASFPCLRGANMGEGRIVGSNGKGDGEVRQKRERLRKPVTGETTFPDKINHASTHDTPFREHGTDAVPKAHLRLKNLSLRYDESQH